MHEIPIDMTPEQLEHKKQLDELFEPIKRNEFYGHANRHQRRAEEARTGQHIEDQKPQPHSVLTMSGPVLVGRNQPCPCGFGKKYKKCCGIGA